MLWGKHKVGMTTDDKHLAAAEIAGVSPLLPPVLWGALFERAVENGDGRFAGFQARVFAARFRVDLAEVERVLDAFAELAMIAGDRLINWAKHQGERAVAAGMAAAAEVGRVVSSSAARMRRKRARDRSAAGQGELFACDGGASHPPVTCVTCDAVSALPPAPPSREYIKNTPYSPPRGTRGAPVSRDAVLGRTAEALQGEILMPIRGGRRGDPPLNRRAKAHQDYLAYLAQWAAEQTDAAAA